MPEITGALYTVRLTKSDGSTFRIEVQDLAWRGFDTTRWRFSDWPPEKVIAQILVAYRPTDSLIDSWFIKEVDIDRRKNLLTTKAKAIGRAISPTYTNASISVTRRVEEYEQISLGDF